jgi:hypothetical protein
VKDPDERKVGRAFSSKVTELALANYPGFFGGGPSGSQAFGVYWPAVVPSDLVYQEVVVDGKPSLVESTRPPASAPEVSPPARVAVAVPSGPTQRVPLGRVIGARSGDKGGNANLGVWARSDEGYAWLESFLTVPMMKELMAETRDLTVARYELPNIKALNFVITGLLGEGVAASTRMDAQAKGLGEYLRAKVVDVPESLLGAS